MTDVDIIQAGSGPTVILVHSSVAGARQWRRLMSDLEDHFHLIAVNLFGYVSTPAWSGNLNQTLKGQARLVEAVVPEHKDKFSLIGHSFGGSVAMKAAAKFGSRIDNLILLDLNSMAEEKHSPRASGYAIALRNADMPMNGQKQRRNSLTIGVVQKLGPPCRTNVKPHSPRLSNQTSMNGTLLWTKRPHCLNGQKRSPEMPLLCQRRRPSVQLERLSN